MVSDEESAILRIKDVSLAGQSVIQNGQRIKFPILYRGVTEMSFPNRQMYDVSSMNLKCATCSVEIKELPFQPSGNRPVYCKECNRGRARSSGSSGARGYGGYHGGHGRGRF